MANLILDQQCTTTSSFFNNEYFGYSTNMDETGETFFPSVSQKLGQITVKISKIGSPTDDIKMTLWSVSSHKPVAMLEESSTILDGSTLAGNQEYSFVFSDTELDSSTEYAWILKRTGAVSTTDSYLINRTNGTDDYSGYAIVGGITWGTHTTSDRWFMEYYIGPSTITGVSTIQGVQTIQL